MSGQRKSPAVLNNWPLTFPQAGEETWLPTEQKANYTPGPSWILRICKNHDTAAVNCFASATGTYILALDRYNGPVKQNL